jgi:hypothetical protein
LGQPLEAEEREREVSWEGCKRIGAKRKLWRRSEREKEHLVIRRFPGNACSSY